MGRSGVRAATASSIEIDFYYRGVRCRERIRLKPTRPNIQYAVRLKGEIENAIARGTFDYAEYFPYSKRVQLFSENTGSRIKIKDALEDWLNRKAMEVESSTLRGYTHAVENKLIPRFGHLFLTEFNRRDLRTWLDSLDVSRKRIVNLLIPLRAIFADAVADEHIETDPFLGWRYRRKYNAKDDEIDPFTPDEIKRILAAAESPVRYLFQFAFSTGLRTSELIGLKWSDINDGHFKVQRAVVNGELKKTKTASGKRKVKLLPKAAAALEALKQHDIHPEGWVFLSPRTGNRWRNDQEIRERDWKPVLKNAGVRYRYPYQTRHTYASMMLSAGENPMWVAQQMGHKDWSMIVKSYGRYLPDANPQAGNKGAALFD